MKNFKTILKMEKTIIKCGDINPIQDGFFWGCSWMGGGAGLFGPSSLKSATQILQL